LKGLLLAKNNFLRIFGDIEDFFKEWQLKIFFIEWHTTAIIADMQTFFIE
jgi:hypothetical protein